MQREEVEAADEIRKLIFKFVKYYKGKGPQYVNVNLSDSNITVYIKGVFTNLDKLLYENTEEEELRVAFKNAMAILKKELIDEINETLNINCAILSAKINSIDDSITLVFSIL
ncbi:MAG: hypothetical protein K0R54_4477, partial [Clostridiaceae bacterium]|nr:hypothetical protein [Clostridiaceae bacterium]